jgi:hypothetical protein
MRTFREPALALTTFLAPFASLLLLHFTSLSPEAQAAWNATFVAVAGAGTAYLVAREKLAASLVGAGQAIVALLAVHGAGLDAEQATAVSGLLALAAGAYVRTQVTLDEPAPEMMPVLEPGEWPDDEYDPEPDPRPEPIRYTMPDPALVETRVSDIAPVPAAPGVASPPRTWSPAEIEARIRSEQRDYLPPRY